MLRGLFLCAGRLCIALRKCVNPLLGLVTETTSETFKVPDDKTRLKWVKVVPQSSDVRR